MPSNRSDVDPSVKRQEIRSAARSVFFREGFEKASVAKIAREAGVTPNTLYWYYPGKEQLFSAVVAELIELFLQGLESRDLKEPLEETLHWVIQMLESSRPLIVTIHEKDLTCEPIAKLHQHFHERMAALFGDRLRVRGMSPERIPALINIGSFVIEGILMHELRPEEKNRILHELAQF